MNECSPTGYQTTLCLAKQGAQVIMACRNSKKAEEAVSKIRCAHVRTCLDISVDAGFGAVSPFLTTFTAILELTFIDMYGTVQRVCSRQSF